MPAARGQVGGEKVPDTFSPGTMVMIPVLLFSILVRKFLVHGLTAGALKG